MVQRVKGVGKIVVGVGDASEGKDAVFKAFDGPPGDVDQAEVRQSFPEKFIFARHGCTRFGDRFDECGEILRGDKICVGTAQSEMGLDELNFTQGMHFSGAGGLIMKVG